MLLLYICLPYEQRADNNPDCKLATQRDNLQCAPCPQFSPSAEEDIKHLVRENWRPGCYFVCFQYRRQEPRHLAGCKVNKMPKVAARPPKPATLVRKSSKVHCTHESRNGVLWGEPHVATIRDINGLVTPAIIASSSVLGSATQLYHSKREPIFVEETTSHWTAAILMTTINSVWVTFSVCSLTYWKLWLQNLACNPCGSTNDAWFIWLD